MDRFYFHSDIIQNMFVLQHEDQGELQRTNYLIQLCTSHNSMSSAPAMEFAECKFSRVDLYIICMTAVLTCHNWGKDSRLREGNSWGNQSSETKPNGLEIDSDQKIKFWRWQLSLSPLVSAFISMLFIMVCRSTQTLSHIRKQATSGRKTAWNSNLCVCLLR